MDRTFSRIKTQSLNRLDLSKKGSVDEDIEHVVSLLNSCEQFFTTSSCSGRIILIDGAAGSSDAHKQNCVWLFVSHQKCTCDDLVRYSLSRACGDAVLKFEPFVLHVQCRRLEDAQLLHSVAVNSGFRNSGLTVGKTGKIVSAVRSTHGLEVPLSRHGKLLVDEDYIQFLTQIANQKMEENLRRVQRLAFWSLQENQHHLIFGPLDVLCSLRSSSCYRRRVRYLLRPPGAPKSNFFFFFLIHKIMISTYITKYILL
uniref:tRNA wybutosine-synthesizing protein 3 homolog n=1 Tax=Xiphophorus couchianus TaxID=32473 RepID=A0A3B5KQV8_9TELE